MEIGDKVKTSKNLRNYGGLKGVIKKFNDGEIGVLFPGKYENVWFHESELEIVTK